MLKFSHGIDLTSIDRKEFNNQTLIKRFLNSNEYLEYQDKIIKKNNEAKWLAAKWAIKEAFFKATNNKIGFDKIEVRHINNKPYIVINDQIESNIDVSISYENNFVIASVFVVYNN